jgi:hypothetical protein
MHNYLKNITSFALFKLLLVTLVYCDKEGQKLNKKDQPIDNSIEMVIGISVTIFVCLCLFLVLYLKKNLS